MKEILIAAGPYVVTAVVAFVFGTVRGKRVMGRRVRKQSLRQLQEQYEQVVGKDEVTVEEEGGTDGGSAPRGFQ
jgi:hypothetical protein